MYDVTGYKNTGFNSSNIPDSQSLLRGMDAITLEATDVMQDEHLADIEIFTNWENIKDIDYIQIGAAFYTVPEKHMTSPDVCRLSLEYDAFTSLGGVSGVSEYLDGVVTRAHVSDDTFGKWTQVEPFTPSAPLQIVQGSTIGDTGDQSNATVLVLSTVDLTDDALTAKTYTDSSDSSKSVTVPSMKAASGDQLVALGYPSGDATGYKYAWTPGARLYVRSKGSVRENLQRVHDLGMDAGILGMYTLPNTYAEITSNDAGLVTGIRSHAITGASGLPYVYDTTVKNNKCFLGQCSAYMLLSKGSGDSAEYMPEELYAGGTEPDVLVFADLRYQQKPYGRPTYVNGDAENLYFRSVPGQVWADAPLRYEGKSGRTLDAINYDAERRITTQENAFENADLIAKSTTPTTAIGRVFKGLSTFIGSIGTTDAQTAGDLARYSMTADATKQSFSQLSEYEKAALSYASGQIVAPTIAFPRSDSMRDFFGNGFQAFRYRLQDADLKAFDRFLTMYGYAMTKTIELTDFTNRTYFNFIKCDDITIGGTAPRWKREAAAEQLRGGVRIWHVKPSATYYTSGNPVKS